MIDFNKDDPIEDWNSSYIRRKNFVFWPSEGSIRFISRYIRKRVGLDIVQDVTLGAKDSKVLDLSCGIGRHIQFGLQMGLGMYGIELSAIAVDMAQQWMNGVMPGAEADHIRQSDIRNFPGRTATSIML